MLLLAACRPGELADDGTGFAIAPPPAFVAQPGEAVSQPVTLHSLSRSAQTISLSTAPPFDVSPRTLSLEGGASADVTVTFAPLALGTVEGTLTAGAQRAALEGTAVTCARDGAACSTACIVGGTCRDGACVGDARSCDDGDACTVDLCDSATGCAHAAVQCEAAAGPCSAAFCDPVTGCATRPAEDGTKCGDSDCATSHVCLAGSCVERATPEGAACGEASPCQDPGTCRGQSCVRPPARALEPVWSYAAPGGYWNFDFPGVADTDGNLYWWESQSGSVAQADDHVLVSVDADGGVRFRAPLGIVPEPQWDGAPGLIQLSGDLVLIAEYSGLFTSTAARIQAYERTSGALAWSHDFLADARAADPCPPAGSWQGAQIMPPASDGNGGLFVKVDRWCGDGEAAGFDLFHADALTGDATWIASGPNNFGLVVADALGNAYAATDLSEVTSWDRGGHERWRHTWLYGFDFAWHPLGVYGDLLVVGNRAVELSTFAVTATYVPAGWAALHGSAPIITDTWFGVFTMAVNDAPTFEVHDASTGRVLGEVPLAGAIGASQPILTRDGTVLVTTEPGRGSPSVFLNGLGTTSVRFSCALDIPPGLLGSPTLRHGRYTLGVQDQESGASGVYAFDLPGAEPAEHGWVTSAGKMTKESRPR